ncbi:hypothetical protein CYMTET_6007 [Cymbomonas tetramitiformis]|uniref:Uncharacterized protein n=1 Tax=Cymbomonas tetramitiformis TaxID=36881 RepID=A0AAE0GYB1_9CHLO|nr:hypothetical protein CYMTET_6007 [Cymbomonas tetramitiformis]
MKPKKSIARVSEICVKKNLMQGDESFILSGMLVYDTQYACGYGQYFHIFGSAIISAKCLPQAFISGFIGLLTLKFGDSDDDSSSTGTDSLVTSIENPSAFFGGTMLTLGFLLVYRISLSYARYWEGRDSLMEMLSKLEDVAVHAGSFGHKSLLGARWTASMGHMLINYLCFAFADLRGILDMAEVESHFPVSLTNQERELLTPHPRNRTIIMISFIVSSWVIESERGLIRVESPISTRTYQIISEIQLAFAAAQKIRDTPFPFPLVQTMGIFLHLFAVSAPPVICSYIPHQLLGPSICFLATLTTFAINRVSEELEDPFGDDPNDLPLDHYMRCFQSSMFALGIMQRNRGKSLYEERMRASIAHASQPGEEEAPKPQTVTREKDSLEVVMSSAHGKETVTDQRLASGSESNHQMTLLANSVIEAEGAVNGAEPPVNVQGNADTPDQEGASTRENQEGGVASSTEAEQTSSGQSGPLVKRVPLLPIKEETAEDGPEAGDGCEGEPPRAETSTAPAISSASEPERASTSQDTAAGAGETPHGEVTAEDLPGGSRPVSPPDKVPDSLARLSLLVTPADSSQGETSTKPRELPPLNKMLSQDVEASSSSHMFAAFPGIIPKEIMDEDEDQNSRQSHDNIWRKSNLLSSSQSSVLKLAFGAKSSAFGEIGLESRESGLMTGPGGFSADTLNSMNDHKASGSRPDKDKSSIPPIRMSVYQSKLNESDNETVNETDHDKARRERLRCALETRQDAEDGPDSPPGSSRSVSKLRSVFGRVHALVRIGRNTLVGASPELQRGNSSRQIDKRGSILMASLSHMSSQIHTDYFNFKPGTRRLIRRIGESMGMQDTKPTTRAIDLGREKSNFLFVK